MYFNKISVENKDTDVDELNNELDKESPDTIEKFGCDASSYGGAAILYGIVHFLAFLYALYLSFQRNGGFKFLPFLVACCCPWIYIIYAFASKSPYCKKMIQKEIKAHHLCKCPI